MDNLSELSRRELNTKLGYYHPSHFEENLILNIDEEMAQYANTHGVLASESEIHITFLEARYKNLTPGKVRAHYWEHVRRCEGAAF